MGNGKRTNWLFVSPFTHPSSAQPDGMGNRTPITEEHMAIYVKTLYIVHCPFWNCVFAKSPWTLCWRRTIAETFPITSITIQTDSCVSGTLKSSSMWSTNHKSSYQNHFIVEIVRIRLNYFWLVYRAWEVLRSDCLSVCLSVEICLW